MEIEFRVELEPVTGTVDLEGPITEDPVEAVNTIKKILDELYPDAEFIEVEAI